MLAVRLQLIVEEQLRLPARTRSAGCRRTRETSCSHPASAARRCASAATGRRSCPPAPRARADRRACGAPAARGRRLPQLSRESPGRAAHRPECCSTGRTTGARPVRRRRGDSGVPRSDVVGIGFDPKQEIRADEKPFERGANAGIEIAVGPGALIEAQQRLNVLGRRRPAIRTSRQRRQNLRRARASPRSRCAGWHTKMRRRLGESCGTRPLYGPPISSDEMKAGRWGRRIHGSRSECDPVPAPRP